jgi:hypothetical protein
MALPTNIRQWWKSLPETKTLVSRKIYKLQKNYSIGPNGEVTDHDKHSSLLRRELNYGCKKFYITNNLKQSATLSQ